MLNLSEPQFLRTNSIVILKMKGGDAKNLAKDPPLGVCVCVTILILTGHILYLIRLNVVGKGLSSGVKQAVFKFSGSAIVNPHKLMYSSSHNLLICEIGMII